MRNDGDAEVECHLRVERPASASASPAVLTIPAHHSRTAEIIFLASWSPEDASTLALSVRDGQGNQLATFAHELVAGDGSDCSIGIDLREPVLVGDSLAGFTLWVSIQSRSAMPRQFEIDFVQHPSLRFPDRKTVMLAPGEATAFEVAVEWNRSVRDIRWWNHPAVIEGFVPVTRGRRTAVLAWDVIAHRLAKYLGEDDRVARVVPTETPQQSRPAVGRASPGRLKYTELMELKKLEQSVVGVVHVRPAVTPEPKRSQPLWRRMPLAPMVSIGAAIIAIATAALLFERAPSLQGHNGGAVARVTAPVLAQPGALAKPHANNLVRSGPVAQPIWTTLSQAGTAAAAGVDASREQTVASNSSAASSRPPKSVAFAPAPRARAVPVDRNAVVALSAVDAEFATGGRAVNVSWAGSALASATVQVLDDTGRIIASRTVRGSRSNASVSLPRGYRATSVQVIAKGYHGERAVQSAELTAGG